MRRSSLISIALAMILVLTSQAMAVARGSADAVGQMVICVGDGTMTVYTDAEGAPTSAPHVCPDCVLLLNEGPVGPEAVLPQRAGVADLQPVHASLCILSLRGLQPQSRAPPLSV